MCGGGGTSGGITAYNNALPNLYDVASQFSNIGGALQSQWQNNQTPAQMWQPWVTNSTQQYLTNPYNDQAIAGAQQAANIWANQQPKYQRDIMSLQGMGNQMAGAVPGFIQQAENTAPYQAVYDQLTSTVPGLVGNIEGMAGNLQGLASGLPGWSLNLANQTMAPAAQMQAEAAALPQQYGAWAGQTIAPAYQMQQIAAGLPGQGQQQMATTEAPVGFLQNLAYQAPGVAQGYANTATSSIPTLQGQMGNLAGYQGQAASTFAPLTNAANAIINTGFDPQNALFSRTQQQLLDQQNAINAMSGVANSPYGAGLAGQQLSNFDINWQNNLLNRMATAGGAAQGLYGQALSGLGTAGNLGSQISGIGGQIGNLASTGAGIVNAGQTAAGNLAGQAGNLMSQGNQQYLNALQAMNALNQGAGNLFGRGADIYGQGFQLQNQLNQGAGSLYAQGSNIYNQGVNTAGNLSNIAGSLYGQVPGLLESQYAPWNAYANQAANLASAAGTLGAGAQNAYAGATDLMNRRVQGAAAAGLLPQQVYGGIQTGNLGALGQGINLGQSQYQLPQNLLQDITGYIGAGTGAANAQAGLASVQNQAAQNQMAGFGSLFGNLLGVPTFAASGGLLGLMGIPGFSSGLGQDFSG